MRALLVAMTVAAACGQSSSPQFAPLYPDGTQFRDRDDKVVLLRGVNARVKGVFDVEFDDGRTALEPIPELTAADCRRMRALGFDVLRLPINWSGIEPQPGEYDPDYLAAVDAAVECAADAGLFVLIDLHQDAYSKEIGEDGAPLWAIVPVPETLLEGPLEDLDQRRLSEQVSRAFDSFFDAEDAAGLQAAFIAMLERVGARYADHPAVVGYEIFNEPVIEADLLDRFQFAAAAALREVAPTKLIFFEPPAIRNFLDFQPLAPAPFPVTGAVYAPHIYTFVFGNGEDQLADLTEDALRPSVDSARAEATSWGTPLFIGEYGVGPDTTSADLWMQYENQLQDQYLASSAFWVWKERSQGRWGIYDYDDDSGSWTERPQVVGWVSRFYPQRIDGDPIALDYDGASEVMTLQATGTDHVVYVPERHATGFAATCDGTPLDAARDPEDGTISVTCAGTLVVGPAD